MLITLVIGRNSGFGTEPRAGVLPPFNVAEEVACSDSIPGRSHTRISIEVDTISWFLGPSNLLSWLALVPGSLRSSPTAH